MEFSVNGWHEWLCHTNFSFLNGASDPATMIERAVRFGYRSVGISDFDGVYGIARAYRALKSLRKDCPDIPLKLKYGVELHLEIDNGLPVYLQDTIVLYALTRQGYLNLCKLITYSHHKGKKEPVLPLDVLLSSPVEDLVAIQPMRGLIRRGDSEQIKWMERLGKIRDHFCGRLYLTVSRHLNPAEDCWIPKVFEVSRQLNIQVLPAQDD